MGTATKRVVTRIVDKRVKDSENGRIMTYTLRGTRMAGAEVAAEKVAESVTGAPLNS